jgi:hypothetical protein
MKTSIYLLLLRGVAHYWAALFLTTACGPRTVPGQAQAQQLECFPKGEMGDLPNNTKWIVTMGGRAELHKALGDLMDSLGRLSISIVDPALVAGLEVAGQTVSVYVCAQAMGAPRRGIAHGGGLFWSC